MTLTTLEADALRVVTELAGRGEPPALITLAAELDVTLDEAVDVAVALREARHVYTDGMWWYPHTAVDLLPDEVFVGFFEDMKLVEEFDGGTLAP
jgi:hypothetical protein